MTNRWAIGVDGGGTKTALLAVNEDGILRRAESGPCTVSGMPPDAAAASVRGCIESLSIASSEIASMCIGVAGYSAISKRAVFLSSLSSWYPSASIELAPDYLVAHTGAFDHGVGIILIAGTGSISYGVNPIGECSVNGGWGYLIDDVGSGYGLGRQAINAFSKNLDGISGTARLANDFSSVTGIKTREDLIDAVYGGSLDRASIASLSKLVSDAAAGGDSYANSVLMHAGGALARVAQSTIARLFKPNDHVVVAKAGSLWQAGKELNSVFERSLLRSNNAVQIVDAAASPVEGALRRAKAKIT